MSGLISGGGGGRVEWGRGWGRWSWDWLWKWESPGSCFVDRSLLIERAFFKQDLPFPPHGHLHSKLSEPETKVSVYRNLTRAPGDLLVSGCGFNIFALVKFEEHIICR